MNNMRICRFEKRRQYLCLAKIAICVFVLALNSPMRATFAEEVMNKARYFSSFEPAFKGVKTPILVPKKEISFEQAQQNGTYFEARYNSNGYIVEVVYFRDGEVRKIQENKLDKSGKLIESTKRYPDGRIIGTYRNPDYPSQ